jgi:hypothetical protein
MSYRIFSVAIFVFLTSFSDVSNIKISKSFKPVVIKSTTVKPVAVVEETLPEEVMVYNTIDENSTTMPSQDCFTLAFEGFKALKEKGKVSKNVLTIIDFSKSSNTKRLWVIDLDKSTVLYNTLVAHGKNTGGEFARYFSNIGESNKSSLGFYTTGETYFGKHGRSLKLDGMERGVNSNARKRAVVLHGADYVSEKFIRNHRFLGRSQGCPAVPANMNDKIISAIKGKSCLFIYHPSRAKKSLEKLLSQ